MAVRLALIGCGAIARRSHLPAFKAAGTDVVDVVAFASRTRASADAAAGEWGSGEVVDDWRVLLARDDIDAVALCTPNALHAEAAIAFADAGKHVLVEKPMACTLAEADAMLDAAERAGVVLMTAHNFRCAPPFVAAAAAVARGDIGDVRGVRVAFGHAGPKTWAPEATWFFDPALAGGGALIDLGIHVADLLRAVTHQEVTEVAAIIDAQPGAVDNAAQLALRLSGGGTGTLSASWIVSGGPDIQLSVFGSDGILQMKGGWPAVNGERVDAPEAPLDLFGGFALACAGKAPPPLAATDGRAALAIVQAGYLSSRKGRAVAVDVRQ